MGHKVNPVGFRLGVVRDHNSLWYAEKDDYKKNLSLDFKLRSELDKLLMNASISKIEIKRLAENAIIRVHTSTPGIVLGKKGGDVERYSRMAREILGCAVQFDIVEVSKPELSAKLVAANIAQQLERRVMFRRAMKRAVQVTMRAGAEGMKVIVSGRLGGAEIARSESAREGRVPLHTLRADIDYALAEAQTTYGVIGVKVWIFRGVQLRDRNKKTDSRD